MSPKNPSSDVSLSSKQDDTNNISHTDNSMPQMPELTEVPAPEVVKPPRSDEAKKMVQPQHPLMSDPTQPSSSVPSTQSTQTTSSDTTHSSQVNHPADNQVSDQVHHHSQANTTQQPSHLHNAPNVQKTSTASHNDQHTNAQTKSHPPVTSSQSSSRKRKPRIAHIQKKGSKLSLKKFLIGCGVFLIVVVGLISLGLYYIVQNPEQIGGVVDVDTVKQGLRIFAILFFAFLFFLGLGFVVVNAYRLSTTKEGSKIGYVAGVMMGIVFIAIAVGAGIVVLQNIAQISGTAVRTDNTVLVQVPTSPRPRYLHNSPGIQLIAPISLSFQLNRNVFERTVMNALNNNEIQDVILDCGNGQRLRANPNTLAFDGSCLYLEKGSNPLTLTILHRNRNTGIQEEYQSIVDTIPIVSAFVLETSTGPYQLNQAQTEISVGQAPAKIRIDANQVFQDTQLENYEIDWDMDEDGNRDIQDDVAFEFNLFSPGVNTLRYTLPGLGEYVYELPVRVAQSDVPICQLQTEQLQESNYQFSVLCDDPSMPIAEYSLRILSYPSDEVVYETKSSRPSFNYSFDQAGQYVFHLDYITREGERGSYESVVMDIGGVMHEVIYSLSYTTPRIDQFQSIEENEEASVYTDSQEIVISQLPVTIQLRIDSIVPLSTQTNTQVLYADNPILPTDENIYDVRIDDPENQVLEIRIREGNQEGTRIRIPIRIQQAAVRGQLRALGGTVGFDPFQVRLDASTVSLADEEDEIIYFSRDFGDGTVKPNTSQGSMTHTYTYDTENENGRYQPRVTIMTKKGTEETILLENPILVKKRAMDIAVRSPSHISQIAGVDEQVSLSLATDGDPRQVLWDFGDGQTFECDSRSCFDTSVTYTTPGTYAISVSITYSNGEVAQSAPLTMIVE